MSPLDYPPYTEAPVSPMRKARDPILTAALASPDKDIPVPAKGQRSSSFAASVQDLEPGQSASRVQAVLGSITVANLPETLREMKETLRNNMTSTVAAAKRKTGGTYTIETGELVMPGGTMYVVAVVTRIE